MTTKPQRVGNDLAESKVIADINEYGWHCMNVIDDDGRPPWSFTIGLHETWHFPELIVIGRSRATAYAMLSTIAGELEDARPPDLKSQDLYLLLGIACQFIEVNEHYYTDYVGIAR